MDGAAGAGRSTRAFPPTLIRGAIVSFTPGREGLVGAAGLTAPANKGTVCSKGIEEAKSLSPIGAG